MIQVMFLGAMIVALVLAWQGLIGGKLQFSSTKTLTGRSARLAGAGCLLFALACVAGIVWASLQILSGK